MNVPSIFISDSLSDYHYMRIGQALGDYINKSIGKLLLISYKDEIISALIPIASLPENFYTKKGIQSARQQFLYALNYYQKKLNFKIVLLAASTKRLFGKVAEIKINENGDIDRYGKTIQELYPNILFTNGDNGTAIILNKEIIKMLQNIEFNQSRNTVLLNGLGILGVDSLKLLKKIKSKTKKIFVISKHSREISDLLDESIAVYENIATIPKQDLVNIKGIINCTHHPNSMITKDKIDFLDNKSPIYIIDVAVPYGLPYEEYIKCNNIVRQDAGNAYIASGLEYMFNPEICALTDNVIYGCFAEALCLGLYIDENPDNKNTLRNYDWFNINNKTKSFVSNLFEKYGFDVPPVPYNFMKPTIND